MLGGHQRASYNEDTRGFPIGSLSCLVLPVPIQSKLRESYSWNLDEARQFCLCVHV